METADSGMSAACRLGIGAGEQHQQWWCCKQPLSGPPAPPHLQHTKGFNWYCVCSLQTQDWTGTITAACQSKSAAEHGITVRELARGCVPATYVSPGTAA